MLGHTRKLVPIFNLAASRSRHEAARLTRLSLRAAAAAFSTSPASAAPDKILPADSFISWDATKPVKLRMTETGYGSLEPMTMHTMMRKTVDRFPDKVAMTIKRGEGEATWTYSEYYSQARQVAKGFMALELGRYRGVGIMGNNTPEWFLSSVGSILAGGLCCGLYTTNSADTVAYITDQTPLDLMVVEDGEMLRRVLGGKPLKQALPNLKKVILMDNNNEEFKDDNIIAWSDLMKLGEAVSETLLDETIANQAVNEACIVIYTSGTTGKPKGAIISHDNLTWASQSCMDTYKWDSNDVIISFLPLSHIAALMVDCYMNIYIGAEVKFADKNALKGTLVDNLKAIRPTKFLGVPRVWEKMYEKMVEAGKNSSPIKKAIGDWAKRTATQHHENVRIGNTKESLSYKLARALVFRKVHEALGLDRAAGINGACYSGAAPMSMEVFHYFQSLDIVLEELMGCTETTGPQTCNLPGPFNLKVGTCGRNFIGVDNKILNPEGPEGKGELATSARNVFMGYLNDEKTTLASFTEDQLFYKSGDYGFIDSDGFLTISGRLKEIAITSGGKNIAPVPIEVAIKKQLPDVISNVIIVADGKKYPTCLMTLKVQVDPATLQPTNVLEPVAQAWCKKLTGHDVKTVEDFLGDKEGALDKAIDEAIGRANAEAQNSACIVKGFKVLKNEFSLAGGELTPTLKIKRFFIMNKYKEEIDLMYSN